MGNIFGDKATEVLIEALQREKDPTVLWSILISLNPRVSENNLDQVLELLQRTRDVHLIYSIYLIATKVKPQLYGAELIKHIPNINDNEYIEEVEPALRRLSDGEFLDLINSLKDWTDSLKKASLLLSFAKGRGDEIGDQIQAILFPNLQGSITPMMDWVVDSLLQKDPSGIWSGLSPDWRNPDWQRRLRTRLEREYLAKSKNPSGR